MDRQGATSTTLIESNEDNDAFSWFGDLAEKGTKHRLGKDLRQFKGRELSGIVLEIDDHTDKTQQHRFQFTRIRAAASDPMMICSSRALGQTPPQPMQPPPMGILGILGIFCHRCQTAEQN